LKVLKTEENAFSFFVKSLQDKKAFKVVFPEKPSERNFSQDVKENLLPAGLLA
jgi:hypothetical protein